MEYILAGRGYWLHKSMTGSAGQPLNIPPVSETNLLLPAFASAPNRTTLHIHERLITLDGVGLLFSCFFGMRIIDDSVFYVLIGWNMINYFS